MNKKPSFFRQAAVLIQRYFNIFINSKRNIIITIAIPLLTILLVGAVAAKDMYAVKPDLDDDGNDVHIINSGYPVLNWERVFQEEKDEDKDKDKDKDDDDDDDKDDEIIKDDNKKGPAKDNVLIEYDDVTDSSWNGSDKSAPNTPTKMNGENYFLITSGEQLAFLSDCAYSDLESQQKYLTYNYLLQVDIDLKKNEFKPIGNSSHPFTGTFDGNGHIIKNLKITKKKDNVGLFGCVKSDEGAKDEVEIGGSDMTFYHNGIVKNLQVQSPEIKASGKQVGVIAGFVDKTARIFSVSAKGGSVSADGGFVGGIVGIVNSAEAHVHTCYSTTKVISKGDNVGGIVGKLGSGRLSAAYTLSEIDADGKKLVGAVVGQSDNSEQNIKNVFYKMEKDDDKNKYDAVSDKDDEKGDKYGVGRAQGVLAADLKNYAPFLVPFKDIQTAREIKDLKDKDEKIDKQEDKEKDKDLDDSHGFKKDDQLHIFNGTQTGLFLLVCVAIFVGICNSIQEICKERNILKREYMTNLNLGSYVVSKLVVQAVVCAIQMAVVVAIFTLFVRNKIQPESGVIFSSMWLEYYITMFLLAFAADTTSLVVSALVKSSATATTFIPIILIVQIIFSGVLFDMKGVMEAASNLMLSKWGTEALAASTGLNNALPNFLIDNPSYMLQLGSQMSMAKDVYASTAANLLKIWGVLFAFIVVCSVACRLILMGVKKDER